MQQNYMISHVQIRTTLGESTGYQSLGCTTRPRGGVGVGSNLFEVMNFTTLRVQGIRSLEGIDLPINIFKSINI